MTITSFPGGAKAVYFPGAGKLRVESIQSGTVTIDNGNTSGTDTINSVDVNNSIILFVGCTIAEGGSQFFHTISRVVLTNATTITAERSGSIGEAIAGYVVIEFFSGAIKSIQRGNIAIGAADTTETATITAVNAAKSAVFALGIAAATGSEPADTLARLELTDATTVTATRVGNSGTSTIGYQVVEFY